MKSLLILIACFSLVACTTVYDGPGHSEHAPGQIKKSTGLHPKHTNPGKGNKK